MKTAIISGISGQDGSYLAELLLDKGYRVVGLCRRQSSTASQWRIGHLIGNPNFIIAPADLCDQSSLNNVVAEYQPEEVYNLAAQSFVPASWEQPVYTGDVDALGVTRILEAVKRHAPKAKVVQASSSEMFGNSPPPQNESTPFRPRSPYGVAKVYGYYIARNYRESFGLHVSNCIAFNHGSPRRGPEFVEQKVATYAGDLGARIAEVRRRFPTQDHWGAQETAWVLTGSAKLKLGNLDAERDWLHAKDVVRAMWLMTQADQPDDYVIASGETHSIRELCKVAFAAAGIDDWERWVEIDPTLYRPAEVPALCGDPTKAGGMLAWQPLISFEAMVREMVEGAKVEANNKREAA